jgi:enoyl-CoA hydratase
MKGKTVLYRFVKVAYMEKYIVTRENNGIVTFIINRPDKRNAIDYEIMDGLLDTIKIVEQNPNDKVLVITGSGEKAFCAGGDLAAFQSLLTKDEAFEMLSKMGDVLYKLCTLSKPTVALLNGTAIGGGAEIATACDYRIASDNSLIGFVQGNLGITTGWGGASILLEKLPYDKAFYMLTSAGRFTVSEAKELGFIQKVTNLENRKLDCLEFLTPLLTLNINVLVAYKKVSIQKWNANNLRGRMLNEIMECSYLWESSEHHHAVKKFLGN